MDMSIETVYHTSALRLTDRRRKVFVRQKIQSVDRKQLIDN